MKNAAGRGHVRFEGVGESFRGRPQELPALIVVRRHVVSTIPYDIQLKTP